MNAPTEGQRLRLHVLPGTLALCRLDANADVPSWARGDFVSITRTMDELSIVCAESLVPVGVQQVRGYSAIVVQGPLAPELVGVLASMAGPLARAGIPIVAIGTFDTDYVLVRAVDLAAAMDVLRAAGHAFAGADSEP